MLVSCILFSYACKSVCSVGFYFPTACKNNKNWILQKKIRRLKNGNSALYQTTCMFLRIFIDLIYDPEDFTLLCDILKRCGVPLITLIILSSIQQFHDGM